MTAVILAAGVGKRFGPAALRRPKCLVPVAGRPLLARMLDILRDLGVPRAVIVVGHLQEQVRQAVASWRLAMGIEFVVNERYTRGAILSLWSARDYFDDDLLIMDADVFFPPELLARLVRSSYPSCFLLDGTVAGTGEEQMLMVRQGRVWDIARRTQPGYELVGESVGFLKLARPDAQRLRELLDRAVAEGRLDIEHEELYPELLRERPIGYERVDGMAWSEVDFPEDLERIEQLLQTQVGKGERRGTAG